MVAAVGAAVLLAGCSGEKAKNAASKVTEKTVELTKGTFTGIDEGFDKGRKATQSVDGALIVSTRDEFSKNVAVEILAVAPGQEKGMTEIQVGFVNAGEMPVRVTELAAKGNLLLLDTDGYVCPAHLIPAEVTIPEKAKLKVSLGFTCEPGKVGKLRIYGKEIEIPRDRIAEPKPASAGSPAAAGNSTVPQS